MADVDDLTGYIISDSSSYGSSFYNGSGIDLGSHKLEAKIIPAILFTIMLIGLVGNSIVIFVILRAGNGRVKSATNCYIINLAVTDICFLLCCVPWTSLIFVFHYWKFGRFMCRFAFYMMHVTAQATCLTLTAMSVDRYQAIVRPLKSMQNRSTREVSIIISVIWLFSLTTGVPVFLYCDINQYQVCTEMWPLDDLASVYAIYCIVMMYLGPLTIISMCYLAVIIKVWEHVMPGMDGAHLQYSGKEVRRRRHVTWMVLMVVLVFALCWLPLYIFNIWIRVAKENFPKNAVTYVFKTAGLILAYSNSCVNPIIYSFMGQNFRRHLKRVCPICCSEPKNGYAVGASRRTGTTSADEHRMVRMRGGSNYSMTADSSDMKRPSNGSMETYTRKVAI